MSVMLKLVLLLATVTTLPSDGRTGEKATPCFEREFVMPQRVVWSSGENVANARQLLTPKYGQVPEVGWGWVKAQDAGCGLKTTTRAMASILLDFGRELHGSLQIAASAKSPGGQRVRVRFGESVGEAMSELGDRGSCNDHAIRDSEIELPMMGTREIGNTGFRFVRIDLLSQGNLILEGVRAISVMRHMKRLGSFRCSDERLNRVFDTSVRTVHLCCQDYLWDGIKRDRLVWMGDTYPETMAILNLFGADPILPESLDYISATTPEGTWVNDMCCYTLWWIRNLAAWHRYADDTAFLNRIADRLDRTARQVARHVSSSNTWDVAGTWDSAGFLDWPTEHNRKATADGKQALARQALEDAAYLAGELGKSDLQKTCRAAADRLATLRLEPHGAKSAAAVLALSGSRSPQEMFDQVLGKDGYQGVSTFYGYFMLEAMSAAGQDALALNTVRDYWGAMLDVGATSFWENFDIAWTNNCMRIDEMPVKGRKDIHGDYGEFCYPGYRHSLCHGWSAGPAAWLINHVLGIRPVEKGCRRAEVRPFLGDLAWAEGAMALPNGECVKVRVEKRPDGTLDTKVDAPSWVTVVGGSPVEQGPSVLKDAFAPTVVGVPPRDAVRDLCETSSGELRHYGRKLVGGEVRPVYVASCDGGLNWTLHLAEKGDVGALVKSPYSGDWIGWKMSTDKDRHMLFCRSKIGPGDTASEIRHYPEYNRLEQRQLLPLRSRRRWVAAFSDVSGRFEETGDCYHALLMLSDDDGRSWRRVAVKPVAGVQLRMPGDRRHRWYNDGCEPTLVELNDGSLLMAVRTSGPNVAFYRSSDGGESWSDGRPDEAFWQSNTMPNLFRLRDGRILFIWNNTQSLPTRPIEADPELHREEKIGVWESFFTNRDALHAAISEDDGRTWFGFRELALSEDRGSAGFRELGNWPDDSHDKSVHQSQAIELKDGKVLVAYGQNGSTRRLAVFDPKWLYEKSRTEDFRHGLENLSTHLYVTSLLCGYRGFSGHSTCNRAPGAMMVRDPQTNYNTCRQVLQLCRIRDPRLVSDRQGVVWNFPSARKGRVEIACRIVGSGFRLSLLDHWINPCDDFNAPRSPVSGEVIRQNLGDDAWHMVACDWDSDTGMARFSCEGRIFFETKMKTVPRFGLSYLHLQTLAEETDPHGTYFRSFRETGESDHQEKGTNGKGDK